MNTDNLKHLDQFTGGDVKYAHPMSSMTYSEGVRYLAQNADCYWLIDAIASYQVKLMKIETFQYLQFWELTVRDNNTAVLECREDSGIPPVVSQTIEYTDFPLPSIKLWVEWGMLILPSEH